MLLGLLTGRTTVVTGASRGLGREMALAMVAAGGCVYGTGRDAKALAETAAAAANLPGDFTSAELDITDPAAVDRVAAEIFSRAGTVHAVVNNAGVSAHGPLVEATDETWSRLVDSNLTGTLRCCRSFGSRLLLQGHGTVLNIASDLGIRGEAGWAPYAATKGGIIALSKSLAWEWAPQLTVNVLAPGAFRTDINRELLADPSVVAALEAATPLRRIAAASEIGPITAFLVSVGASFMTGAVIPFDGGIRRS